ncbi:drug/metabolite transporter (DMT)-like permease [Micromonospora luteifusca]|uniref:Drug/metabolite transporter (DMT)-like permease n=1 Tax=Micromonospora luteifusca TaxID=709860 RepID=A0ABS2LNM9_9ACTN|nr:drug/metabolite transporter (DMT)-like permease [Micromonospora luteifusca]
MQDLDPWFVVFGRAVGAALLAYAYLKITGAARPTRGQWRRLSIVTLGVVVGFPLFTSLALTTQTSAHGAVVITVLPAMTAVFAVLRSNERPPPLFWIASIAGLLAVFIQLAQPVLTLIWSALLLDETVTPASIAAAVVVLACVLLIQRTRANVQVTIPASATHPGR